MIRLFLIFIVLLGALGVVGSFDYADALSVEADMKLLRAQVASRSEHITTPAAQGTEHQTAFEDAPPASAGSIFPLLHPLHCGYWIQHCSDWQPCEKPICLEER